MFKIGLSSCGKNINEELFESYKNAGIDVMEICTAAEKYDTLNMKEISDLSKKYGIELWTYHLPYSPFSEIDISDKKLCGHTIEKWSELIKKASDIGIDKFVVHPSGEPIEDSDRAERIKTAKESLSRLAQIAADCGGVIAVEDLPRSCLGRNSDEIKELISADDRLMVCFDTNHLLAEDNVEFIHKLNNRIITTHVSDYDFINERHWLPGEGKVEWNRVFNALKEINYTGAWLYEIGFSNPKTLSRNRDLTCSDFVRNAKEVFENKSITVLPGKVNL